MRLSDLFVGLFLPSFPMTRVILNCKAKLQNAVKSSHVTHICGQAERVGSIPRIWKKVLETGAEPETKVNYL